MNQIVNQNADFSVVQIGQYVILKPGDLIVQVYGVATEREQCVAFIQGFMRGAESWSDSFRDNVFPHLKILVPCELGTEGHGLGSYFEKNFSDNKGGGCGSTRGESGQIWQDFHLSNQGASILVACMLFPDSSKKVNPLLFAEIMKAVMISHQENSRRVYFGYSDIVSQAHEFRMLIESAQKDGRKNNIYRVGDAHSFGISMANVFEQKIISQYLTE